MEAKRDMNNAESTEVSNSVSDNSLDASAEAQIADSEQATYASANNDLKGTKAYQEADISGLYNLAMAIIDYRGHRVVAQVCVVIFFCWYIAVLEYFAALIMDSVICSFACNILMYFFKMPYMVAKLLLMFLSQLFWTSRVSFLVFFKETSLIHFCMVLLIMARRYLGMNLSIQR